MTATLAVILEAVRWMVGLNQNHHSIPELLSER
jgi:hypothetical protein